MDGAAEREFTEFVAARTFALMRVAYALTGNQHAAEDLLQTALAKAMVRWPHIRTDAEPYVKKILYHDYISWWRRWRRHRETPTAQPPEPRATGWHADDTHLRLVVREALDALPPRQRAVLVLRYLEDLGTDEVAEMLGCRPGTVASQASRGLTKLRAALTEHSLTDADQRNGVAR